VINATFPTMRASTVVRPRLPGTVAAGLCAASAAKRYPNPLSLGRDPNRTR
jgi:hypothetical protein